MSFFSTPFEIASLPVEDVSFGLMPPGVYQVTIEDAAIKATKAGTGEYISLKLRVIGPTHGNAIVWANINYRNQSEVAQAIGLAQLRSLMAAVGITTLGSTDQLIGQALNVKVAPSKPRDGFESSNEVKAYLPIASSTAPTPPVPAQPFRPMTPAAAAPAAASAAPPWAK